MAREQKKKPFGESDRSPEGGRASGDRTRGGRTRAAAGRGRPRRDGGPDEGSTSSSSSSVSETYVVDGYNVLRDLLSPAEQSCGLEVARAALEARLRWFIVASGRGTRVILVYDGKRGVARGGAGGGGVGGTSVGDGLRGGSGEGGVSGVGTLEVLFARPPRKADDLILEICRGIEGPGEIRLVTSDIADIAGRAGGLRLRHLRRDEFRDLLEKRLRRLGVASPGAAISDRASPGAAGQGAPADLTGARGAEKPGAPTGREAREWLREFGLDDFRAEGPETGRSPSGQRR
jgi:hypothetical protein